MKTIYTIKNFAKRVVIAMVLLCGLGVGIVWGGSPASLTWTSDVTHNSAASSDAFDVFTATYTQVSTETAPVYWNKDSKYGIKIYAKKNSTTGNRVTISTSAANTYITNVAVTGSTAQGTCALYWDGSSSTTGASKSYTEASKTQSSNFRLKETGNKNAGQYIITAITVTYVVSGGGGGGETTYTVTYNANSGSGSVTDGSSPYATGSEVTVLPNSGFSRSGYIFTHWDTKDDDSGTDYAEGDKFTISANTTLYAQWVTSSVRDDLSRATTGIADQTGKSVTYSAWSSKTASNSGHSDAVYAGNSAANYNTIQLRASDNSGIVTTTSGGRVKYVSVVWDSNTASGRKLDIYGKNSAYESAADLYENSKKGTKLGTIECGKSTVLAISADSTYIGLRSNTSTVYLTKVSIEWEVATTTTLTLDKNGGASNGSASITVGNGAYSSFTAATPAEGKSCTGYYTNDATPVKVLNADGSFAGTDITGWITSSKWSKDATSATLYARWEDATYTITANLTNISANTSFPTSFTYTGSTTTALDRTLSVGSSYALPTSITVTMGGSTCTNGTEYTYNNSTGAFSFDVKITGDIVITAAGVRKYTITFNDNGNTTSNVWLNGSEHATPSITGCTGYDPLGWTTTAPTSNAWASQPSYTAGGENITVSGDATYYAVYTMETPSTDYVRTSSITSGANYVITYAGSKALDASEYYYDDSSTPADFFFEAVSVSESSSTISNPGANLIWRITGNNTDGYEIYNANQDLYLGFDSDDNEMYLYESSHADYKITFSSQNCYIKPKANDSYYFYEQRFGSNPDYAYYFDVYTSSGYNILFKQSVTTSYISNPDCCAKKVNLSVDTESHATITSISPSSIATCSSTDDDRNVTIAVTAATGYELTSSARLTYSGNGTAAYQSGPGSGPSYSFVYQFSQNDNGSGTFSVSATAKTYTVTLDDNSGSGGSGSKSVTFDANTNLTTSVTVPTKAHYDFDGYYTSTDEGETFGTKLIDDEGAWVASAGGGSTYTDASKNWKYADDLTLYAKWNEHDLTNYRTVCTRFDIFNQSKTDEADIHLTSARGVAVYSTNSCSNLIRVVGKNLGSANRIYVTYLDENDQPVAKTNSVFRMCNNGSSNYNYVDASNDYFAITLTNGNYDQTFSICYEPKEYDKIDNWKLKLELKNGTSSLGLDAIVDLHGRSLPREFVIAAKSGDTWYALPNTLAATEDKQGAITPIAITVDDDDTPTMIENPVSTILYSVCNRYTTANKNGLRLTTDGSHFTQISTTADTYKIWLSGTGGTNVQDWYLKSSDFGAYEVFMDPIGSSTDTRRIELYNSDGVKIGYHGTRSGTGNVYLLPVEYTDMSADITEWGTDHVVLDMRSAGSATKVKTQVGLGALSDAQTLSSIKKDEGVYRVAVTIGASDAAKDLKLLFYNDSEVLQGGAKNTIPLLISANDATTGGLSLSKADAATCDLVVLDGGVLTVSETTDAAKYTFQDLYVYGGGKMVVPTGTYINFSNVYMRGGHLNSSWEYQYSNPQLILNGTMGNSSNTINYDYLTNNAQFYSLALPYQVQLANIVNPYFSNKQSWEIHAYDGTKRASGSQVDGWYDVEVGSTGTNTGNIAALTSSSYLTPGVGYTFWGAMQKVNSVRQKWSINRFPMTLASGSAEATKSGVSVGAYGMTDGELNDGVAVNDAGWNMLGNPYLANIGGTESFESSLSALIVGYHNQKVLDGNGNWTGAWEEVEDDDDVRYVRIPHDNGKDYDQVRVKDATFKSFRHFFIQAATSGTFTFLLSQRDQSAPVRVQKNGATLPDEIDIDFILSNGNERALFGLTVNDKMSTSFVVGEDMPEELGGTNSKAYTIAAENRLTYNGLPSTAAEQYIPVGYRAENAGTYSFAYKSDEYTSYIEHIWLIDYATSQVTDLLNNTYKFSTEQGVFDERFAINVEFGKYNAPTGTEEANINGEKPVKFIRDDKMYIMRNGVIYDATGKKVDGNNK